MLDVKHVLANLAGGVTSDWSVALAVLCVVLAVAAVFTVVFGGIVLGIRLIRWWQERGTGNELPPITRHRPRRKVQPLPSTQRGRHG